MGMGTKNNNKNNKNLCSWGKFQNYQSIQNTRPLQLCSHDFNKGRGSLRSREGIQTVWRGEKIPLYPLWSKLPHPQQHECQSCKAHKQGVKLK